MKKVILLLVAILLVSFGKGQTNTYHPFPDSAYWRVDYQYHNAFQYPCYANYYFQYTIGGDTSINSVVCRKIFRSAVRIDTLSCTAPENPPAAPPAGYAGALKEDPMENKAFFIYPGTVTDSLLFDYNLATGDTLRGIPSATYLQTAGITVLSVDSVLIDGSYRKRWNLSPAGNSPSPFIVEGIGSSVGLIEPLNTYAIDFTDRYLVCVRDSVLTWYFSDYGSEVGCNPVSLNALDLQEKIRITVCPDPFVSMATLEADRYLKGATVQVFSIFGQLVQHVQNVSGRSVLLNRGNLPAGMYFIRLAENGRFYATVKVMIAGD